MSTTQKIILSESNKQWFRAYQEKVKEVTDELQPAINAYNAKISILNTQRTSVLNAITQQADMPEVKHWNLDENLDLVEITEEEYIALTQRPGAMVTALNNVEQETTND